jgi:hypothetical protein
MITEDYQLDDTTECPKCGHLPTHYRHCIEMYCEDGYVDEYHSDPINFMEGEGYCICRECWGTGIEHWCPKCGHNLNAPVK